MGEHLYNLVRNLLILLFLVMGVYHVLSNAALPQWLAVCVVAAGAIVGSQALRDIYQNLWDIYYG